MSEREYEAMAAAFAAWLARSRDLTAGDAALARAAWECAWLASRRDLFRDAPVDADPATEAAS